MHITEQSDVNRVKSALAVKAEIAALTEDLKALGDYFGRNYGIGTHVTDAGSVTISENNTYPKEKIAAALSPGQVRRVSKMVIDPAAAKALYPAAYLAAKETNGTKATFK